MVMTRSPLESPGKLDATHPRPTAAPRETRRAPGPGRHKWPAEYRDSSLRTLLRGERVQAIFKVGDEWRWNL